ncbi:MAG: thymidine phosphorylase [Nanoarchaeota archaeon]
MRLKLKLLKISAGKPVIFLHESSAKKMGIHTGDRVAIRKNGDIFVAIVDLARGLIKKNEVAISEELASSIKHHKGYVEILPSEVAESSFILQNQKGCREYSAKELEKIMSDIVNNLLTEAEIAYFISTMVHCDPSLEEAINLTKAIVKTGNTISWPYKIVADKHSIGGIPGNRTTPIVVSICASAGIIMPKTSSRAIISAAGTADTIESISPVSLSINELKRVVKKTGACLVWGGSLGLAPADDKLIRVEKLLRVDPEAQLIASILAKKISVGSTHVLIDIPYGDGAKVSKERGEKLSKLFILIGNKLGLKIKTILTDGKEPIGHGIGPILEMKDVLKVLKQDNPPRDLEEKALILAGIIIEMVGKAKPGKGIIKAKEILYSGVAYKKFSEIISAQGGDAKTWLPEAKFNHTIISSHSGIIQKINNQNINYLARITGCPIDKASGIYIYKHIGEKIFKGDKLATLFSESKLKLNESIKFFKKQKPIMIV